MPIANVTTHQERLKAERTGVVSDLEGNVFLEPTNYYRYWWFPNKDEWGDPVGWICEVPVGHEGLTFFISEVAVPTVPVPNPPAKESTMVSQNTAPIDNARGAFITNQPWTPGHAPATQAMALRSGLPTPETAPIITKIPVAKGGFAAGVYPIAYQLLDFRGKSSGWSPPIFVTIPQGGRVLVKMPTDLEEGTATVVLGMGAKDGNAATVREQRRWPVGLMPTTYELAGYTNVGRGKPRDQGRKPKKAKAKLRRSHRKLKKGLYEIRTARVTDFGESATSDPVIFNIAEDIPNREIAFEYDPGPDDQGVRSVRFYVTIDGIEYKVFDGIEGSVANASGGVRQQFGINGGSANIQGWANTGNQSGPSGGSSGRGGGSGGSSGGSGSTGTAKASSSTSTKGSSSTQNSSNYVNTGNVQNQTNIISGGGGKGSGTSSTGSYGAGTGTTESKAQTRMERRRSRKEEKQERQQELDDAIPEASSALEDPQILPALAPLAPGNYVCCFARASVNGESLPSPTSTFSITNNGSGGATEVVEIRAPHPLNEITNATFALIDSSGHPLGHTTISDGNGKVSAVDGELILDTVTNITTTATPTHGSNLMKINRNEVYYLHADIEASWSGGTFEVVLEEYASESPTLGTSILQTRTLKTVSAVGKTQYDWQIGPVGTVGTNVLTWHADAVTARIVHRMTTHASTGTSRNMRMRIRNWYMRTFAGGVRRFETDAGNYDVDPAWEVDFPHTSYKIIGPPPSVGVGTGSALSSYLELVDHESGTLPSDWTIVRNVANNVAQIETAAKINATRGFRVQKTTTAAGLINVHKNYTDVGWDSMGVRSLWYFDALPSRGTVFFMSINEALDAVTPSTTDITLNLDNTMVSAGVASDGTVQLAIVPPDVYAPYIPYYITYINTSLKVAVGDTLDLELIGKNFGSGSSNGVAELWCAVNGGTRTKYASTSTGPWGSNFARRAVIGAPWMTDGATTFNFRCDDWMVSRNGTPTYVEPSPIPGEALPEPDRPRITYPMVDYNNFNLPEEMTGTFTNPNVAGLTLSRVNDTSMAGAGNMQFRDTAATGPDIYYQQSFSGGPYATIGPRFVFRVNTYPGLAAEGTIATIMGEAGFKLYDIILTNTGTLYLQPYNAANGAAATSRQLIDSGIPAAQVVLIQTVLTNAGSAGAVMSLYIERNGKRQMKSIMRALPWAGGRATSWRLGMTGQTAPTAQWSIDFDAVLNTTQGERVPEEYNGQNGETIDQVYEVILPNTPETDGVFFVGGHVAVEPGEVYTAQIKTRWAGIPIDLKAYPYWLVAQKNNGEIVDLGCLAKADEVIGAGPFDLTTEQKAAIDGLSGSSPGGWVILEKTLPPIPEDCYVVYWETRDMVEGEYVCQSPVLSHATEATLDVSYPLTGTIRTQIDTDTPKHQIALAPLGRIWRDIETITDEPTGTSTSTTYWSGPTPAIQGSLETSDKTAVPQNRYLNSITVLNGNGLVTPEIHTGSPLVEYTLDVSDTLLMPDGSELPGGVVVGLSKEWKWREKVHYIDLETGAVVKQGTGFAIGDLPGVALQCFSLATKRLLEENWGKQNWMIQTPLEKLLVSTKGDIEFTLLPGSWYVGEDGWAYGWWECETPSFEVLEVSVPEWVVQPSEVG